MPTDRRKRSFSFPSLKDRTMYASLEDINAKLTRLTTMMTLTSKPEMINQMAILYTQTLFTKLRAMK